METFILTYDFAVLGSSFSTANQRLGNLHSLADIWEMAVCGDG